jgi:hypothetical protein
MRTSVGGIEMGINSSGHFQAWQTAAAGTLEDLWWDADRNGGVGLYFNGLSRFATTTDGVTVEGWVLIEQDNDNGVRWDRGTQQWQAYIEDSDDSWRLYDTTNAETHITVEPGGATQINQVAFGSAGLLMSSNAITPSESYTAVQTSGGGAEDLNTINTTNLKTGSFLVIKQASAGGTVTVKDGVGNLRTSGDFAMGNADDTMTLLCTGANLVEISRSKNG